MLCKFKRKKLTRPLFPRTVCVVCIKTVYLRAMFSWPIRGKREKINKWNFHLYTETVSISWSVDPLSILTNFGYFFLFLFLAFLDVLPSEDQRWKFVYKIKRHTDNVGIGVFFQKLNTLNIYVCGRDSPPQSCCKYRLMLRSVVFNGRWFDDLNAVSRNACGSLKEFILGTIGKSTKT